MGNANCNINNLTSKNVLVLTFNNADVVYSYYKEMYKISPRRNTRVEAAADAWGLKVAVVYATQGDRLMYRRWDCSNGATLSLHSISGDNINASGCNHVGTGSIDVSSDTTNGVVTWLGIAIDAAGVVAGVATPSKLVTGTSELGEWAACSGSNQCKNGCCSSRYSNGVLKCTPLTGGYKSDICVNPPPTGSTTTKLGDWTVCSTSNQCQNGCCSAQYSNGVAKCTPLNGGYRSDICFPPGPGARYLRIGGADDMDALN